MNLNMLFYSANYIYLPIKMLRNLHFSDKLLVVISVESIEASELIGGTGTHLIHVLRGSRGGRNILVMLFMK